MGEDTKDIGHRYVSYSEKLKKYTAKDDEGVIIRSRTPLVGLESRIYTNKGYSKQVGEDGTVTFIKDADGSKAEAKDAISYDMASAVQNSLHFESKSILKVVDLISEGPIEGFCSQNGETLSYFGKSKGIPLAEEEFLQSVYFDGTKILNPEIGTLNYRLADVDFRPGDGRQYPLPSDYQFASQSIAINTRLAPSPFWRQDGSNKTVKQTLDIAGSKRGMELLPDWEDLNLTSVAQITQQFQSLEKSLEVVSHTIQNHLVEEVSVNIKIHVLSRLHVGKRSSERIGAECSFLIYLGNESGPFDPRMPVLCEGSPSVDVKGPNDGHLIMNDTGGYFVRVARGMATSDYVFETRFHLPPNFRRENRVIKVFRIERDMGYGAEDAQVECSFDSVVESIPFKLRYPYSAIIGSTIDSTATSRIPKREFDLKLLKMRVPANYIPETKQYFGYWNGTFKRYVPVVDENLTRARIERALAKVTNRAKSDGTKQIKIKTGTKKYGSGSIFFPSSSGLDADADFTKRISIKDAEFKYPIESDDAPKRTLRICDFGFHDFTIEFFIKTSASNIKTIYKTDGTSHTTSGLRGFYKTIISSAEGSVPCGGNNESDENRNDSELYKHPMNRKSLNYVSGNTKQNSLPVAGNWMVEIGTENGTNEMGRIIFRYFTYGAYYRKDGLRVKVLDSDNDLPTVQAQVVLKSLVDVADDAWHHVAITRSGDSFKVWVDGLDKTDTGADTIRTYNGDVRGFVYRSGTEKDSGLIEIGNDRSLRSDGTTAIHSSFSGYLDVVNIVRKCKYTTSFADTLSGSSRGDHVSPNDRATVCLLTGDDQPNDGTKIVDYNPPVVFSAKAVNYIENFGSGLLQWTDNPAWIFYDLITNNRYGLGKYGVNPDFVNKWNIYELGKHCDQLVKTGFASRFKTRNFTVVSPDDSEVPAFSAEAAGEVFVKISGFADQAEFTREFPRYSTVAIFDLDNAKKPVKRVIEYVKIANSTKINEKLYSWLPSDKDTAGEAVIRLLRPLAIEECFLLEPNLKELIIQEQYKRESDITSRKAGLGPRRIIFQRYGDYEANKAQNTDESQPFEVLPGDSDILDFFFEGTDGTGGLKINSTSTSGKIATEFRSSRELLEPRFTCNLYITTAIDAFKVLNDLASVFLGLTYIVGGKVFASFDKPRDPIMNFTNSNVKDGSFVYAGSPKTSRFTTALVRYVDKYENFKPKVEYVEDAAGIIKYGLIEKELIAFGCTSRGQARRLGKWFLFSAQLETDSIQFTASKEASYLRPGDVVKVIDRNKTRKRYGGRIVDVSSSAKQITLDAGVNENVVGEIITIAIPSSFETEETLDQKSLESPVSNEDLANLRKPQIKEFKVSSVDLDKSVPAKRTILGLTALDDSQAEEIGKIKPGAIWILQNSDSNLKIQEILFRVMNIEEENPMEYKISCLEYNRSKFQASEDDAEADKVNVSALAIGGSGQITRKGQFKGDMEFSEEEKRDPNSDYSKYQVTSRGSVQVSWLPQLSIANVQKVALLNDPNAKGPWEYQPASVTITWLAPQSIPDSYNIYVTVHEGTISENPMRDVIGEHTIIFEVEAKDSNSQNVTNFTFNPLRTLGSGKWTSLKANDEDNKQILHVEVRSVVNGNEISSNIINWDTWDQGSQTVKTYDDGE